MNSLGSYESNRHNTMHQPTKKLIFFPLNLKKKYDFLWTILRVDILCSSSLIITSTIYNQNTQRAGSDQLICWSWQQSFILLCTAATSEWGDSAESQGGEPQGWSRQEHTDLLHLSALSYFAALHPFLTQN